MEPGIKGHASYLPWLICAALALILLCSAPAWAQTESTAMTGSEAVQSRSQLIKNQTELLQKASEELDTQLAQEAERTAELQTRLIDKSELDQADTALETLKVKQESVKLDLATAKQNQADLDKQIQQLNERLQSRASGADAGGDKTTNEQVKSELTDKRSLLDLENTFIDQLTQAQQLLKKKIAYAERWSTSVRNAYQAQQEAQRQQSIEELERQINAKRSDWQNQAAELRTSLSKLEGEAASHPAARDLLETKLLQADESNFLLENQLRFTKANTQLQTLMLDGQHDERTLKRNLLELQALQGQTSGQLSLMESKLNLLQQRRDLIEKHGELYQEHTAEIQHSVQIIDQLASAMLKQRDKFSELDETLKSRKQLVESTYLQQKKQGLTERRKLTEILQNWPSLVEEINNLPALILQVFRNTSLALWTTMQQADFTQWSLLFLSGLVWTIFCLLLSRLRTKLPAEDADFSRRALFISSSLLRSTRFDLLVGGLLVLAAWFLEIIPPGLVVILTVSAIWVATRLTFGLSHWILRTPVGLAAPDPGLHRFTGGYALLTALSSLLLIFGHLNFFSPELTDLSDQVFMLLLLPPAYLSLRIRKRYMEALLQKTSRPKWVRLIGLAGLAIPSVILAAALLGILGYINLAWLVASLLGQFMLVLLVFLTLRGLVMDLSQHLEEHFTAQSGRGVLLFRSLLKPLEYVLRLLLFALTLWVLYRLFGGEATVGTQLKSWLTHPLFSVGEAQIDTLDMMGALLLLVTVFYIGRWSREVTYSWFYSRVKDLGIRNSLSVFTQYTVVVIGLLIALNILGIDLTSLAVFAGALGVGIGFGLQNIANNFISGLILLAERPVRSKDWVTIGDKEGEVSQIGMRSVTVTTWDNQDVIIPNSDLISNAFINWTHTNNVVRTVMVIGISYRADPHLAQKVIEEAVVMHPEVSLDPPPRVWLLEFGASSVNFRVHYYIDVKAFSRLEVKSRVLFAIWDALKEAGIEIPFPQQDIYIKELPGTRPAAGLTLAGDAADKQQTE